MARQMVGRRKGAPAVVVAVDEQKAPDAKDGSAPDAANDNVVKCPNCACEFDEDTLDVVKPGKPVADDGSGDPSGYQGADLDASGSALPVPGKMGAAADAARGQQAITNLLANLKGRV